MVLDSMAALVDGEPDLAVVGTAGSLAESNDVIGSSKPDVIVTDYRLGDGTGADVADLSKRLSPDTRVIMITGGDDRVAVESAIATGCAGFLNKGRGIDELLDAIRSVADGAAVFPVDLLRSVIRNDFTRPGATLTDRERDILRRLAAAATVDDMASGLVLSEHTVRNHVRNILAKLGASSKLEAVVIAVRHGLVSIEPGPT